MFKDARTAGNRIFDVDTSLPHFVIVFPEGENQRVLPFCREVDDAEILFHKAVEKGIMIPFDGVSAEWINLANKDYAFIRLITPTADE